MNFEQEHFSGGQQQSNSFGSFVPGGFVGNMKNKNPPQSPQSGAIQSSGTQSQSATQQPGTQSPSATQQPGTQSPGATQQPGTQSLGATQQAVKTNTSGSKTSSPQSSSSGDRMFFIIYYDIK